MKKLFEMLRMPKLNSIDYAWIFGNVDLPYAETFEIECQDLM